MLVEQTRHKLSTILKEVSQPNIRERFDGDSFGDHSFVNSMEQILQISGANLLDPIQLARKTNLAIIAQG
jgi:hypothetical protein